MVGEEETATGSGDCMPQITDPANPTPQASNDDNRTRQRTQSGSSVQTSEFIEGDLDLEDMYRDAREVLHEATQRGLASAPVDVYVKKYNAFKGHTNDVFLDISLHPLHVRHVTLINVVALLGTAVIAEGESGGTPYAMFKTLSHGLLPTFLPHLCSSELRKAAFDLLVAINIRAWFTLAEMGVKADPAELFKIDEVSKEACRNSAVAAPPLEYLIERCAAAALEIDHLVREGGLGAVRRSHPAAKFLHSFLDFAIELELQQERPDSWAQGQSPKFGQADEKEGSKAGYTHDSVAGTRSGRIRERETSEASKHTAPEEDGQREEYRLSAVRMAVAREKLRSGEHKSPTSKTTSALQEAIQRTSPTKGKERLVRSVMPTEESTQTFLARIKRTRAKDAEDPEASLFVGMDSETSDEEIARPLITKRKTGGRQEEGLQQCPSDDELREAAMRNLRKMVALGLLRPRPIS